ncbi:MAG: hypothetical protein K6G26_09375 [Lachnospiraceae bacterium]|nr:hypothetical protein [Lachnospiraceae bacterium]
MVVLLVLLIALCIGSVIALLLWDKPIIIIYVQLIYCCTFRFFKCYLGLPEAIKYVMDFLNVWLIVLTLIEVKKRKKTYNIRNIMTFIFVFMIGTFISFIYNQQPLVLYLWSLRTTLRMISFFVSCIVFLEKSDVEHIIKMFLILLGGNTVMSAFQYFVQGYTFDYNGGLFGFETGCNGYMNIYLCMLTMYAVSMFMYKKKGASLIVYVSVCSMAIAALSELKIYFFEIVFALVVVILTQKPSWRTAVSIGVGVICLVVGVNVFFTLYPYWKDFFTYDKIMDYLTMDYSVGAYTLNRFSGIPYVYNNIMNDWILKVFGTGAGSGDNVFGFKGWIYKEYASLHYEWFVNVMIMLECGIVGFIAYTGFFIAGCADSFKRMFSDVENKAIHTVTFGAMILAIINMWYNSALRLEINYVLAFWLSISYIYSKSDKKPVYLNTEATSSENNYEVI